MTCERYWRDGVVLVERGLDDPHRDGCGDLVELRRVVSFSHVDTSGPNPR